MGEFDPLTYRVYFWGRGNTSYEFEATQARDVGEVIEWANQNAAGRTYTLYAVFMMGSEKNTILLSGVDPTRAP